MYGVLLLTVFVDPDCCGGCWVFIASILHYRTLNLQSRIKLITDTDDVRLNSEQTALEKGTERSAILPEVVR